MKEYRNCGLRAKGKNWDEKVKKKCCIKNALFGCTASCSKGRAYPLEPSVISFALANLYSIDFFVKIKNFTDYLDFEERKNKAQTT